MPTDKIVGAADHGMGQKEFWDKEEKLKKPGRKKPTLERLAVTIPWKRLPPLLESAFKTEGKSPVGWTRIDSSIMLKMLVPQQ